MGSSGTPEIVARILESFEGKPYRVIAPVKFQLGQVPGVRVPSNVLVTDWVPAIQVNKMADLAVIHGGIGTVMAAALAGKPVVGVGMQMEQVANLACLERLGFAISVRKSKTRPGMFRPRSRNCCMTTGRRPKRLRSPKSSRNGTGRNWRPTCCFEHYGNTRPSAFPNPHRPPVNDLGG